MEQFIKKSDELNLESIKKLASQKGLRQRLKANDTFLIANPSTPEVEAALKNESITFKKAAHPTFNLTIYTIQN